MSGSGEGMQRPGPLRRATASTGVRDGGETWTHLGLRDGQQIPQIVVDPRDPDRAVRRGARASIRSQRGARGLPLHRRRPHVRAGALPGREHRCRRRGARPGEPRHRVRGPVGGAAGALGERRLPRAGQRALQVHRRGHHVAALDGGLPDRRRTGWGASASAIAPSDPSRLYAVVGRRGARRAVPDRRCRRDLAPGDQRPARLGPRRRLRRGEGRPHATRTWSTSANVVTWKSIDGGETFTAFRGAPGGDDYQRIWINPDDPRSSCAGGRPGRDHHGERRARRGAPGTTSPRRSSTT